MKRSQLLLFLLLITMVAPVALYAQLTQLDTMQDFSSIEQKKFAGMQAARKGHTEGLTRSMASTNFDINFYRCEWEIDPAVRFITGKVTAFFTATATTGDITLDLSDTLVVDSIIYRGSPVSFQRIAGDGLQIQFPVTILAGIKDSVAIFYQGVPRNYTSFKPFVQTFHNGVPAIWTLSEPFGAKEWWPCKNGLDDKADSVDIIITHPNAYQASSNGIMTGEYITGSKKQSVWKHRYPIASYLVAIAVSNFSVLKDSVTVGGRMMPLIDYAYPEDTAVFNSQRIHTKRAITLFSTLFGDYPFAREKYGYTEFTSGGGMEHQTNTFLNIPTISLIEHETGHQWFGDKITCGSWQDIWLNEGFATYCQVIYNENIDTIFYFPILKNITRDITNFPNGSVWVPDTTSAARIFNTRLSYYKGAYLLHMLRWKLGDDVFFRAIRKYLSDPLLQYKYARTADLKQHLEKESGQDLSIFFQKWFYGEGHPNYNCTWTQNRNNWASVKINQTTSHPSVGFYDMPVQLRFKNNSRDTLITVDNSTNGESFWVNPGFMADSMFVDPNYHILARERIVQKIPASSVMANDSKIYPNPATDKLTVSLFNPTGTQISLQLYNAAGQLVYKTTKQLNGQDELLTIPLLKLAGGAYVLRVADNTNTVTKKVIIN